MLGVEKIIVLLVMQLKTIGGPDLGGVITFMALTAQLRRAIDFHESAIGISGMPITGPMAHFTLYAWKFPGADDAFQVILMPFRTVTRRMAGTTIVRHLLTGMEWNPTGRRIDKFVGVIILCR